MPRLPPEGPLVGSAPDYGQCLDRFHRFATWAAFQNANYYVRPYLSPFYSPCLAARCGYARAGSTVTHPPMVGLFGPWWVISPAIIVLVVPLGFRLTCYCYRKAYYTLVVVVVAPCVCRPGTAQALYG